MSDLRDWEITYGVDDYRLRVYTYTRRSRFVCFVTERIMGILGHPCCGKGLGKSQTIEVFCYKLMNRAYAYEYKHEVTVLDLTVSEDEAFIADPKSMELRNDLRYN